MAQPRIMQLQFNTATVALMAGIILLAPISFAGTWGDRAGKINSKELTRDKIRKLDSDEERDTRNKLTMRRIAPAAQGVDWDTDPTAIPFMLQQVHKRTDLPIYVNNDGLDVASDELFEHLVIYLTSHHAWSFNEKETENLATWLKRGGTLLLDDCYNKGSPFTDSVQPELGKMMPGVTGTLLLESDKKVTDVFSMVYKMPWPGESLDFMRPWQYFLLDKRAAVFFTPNDDGCGWEISSPPTASNPIGDGIGHGGNNKQRELFYKWITNWMMYVYSH